MPYTLQQLAERIGGTLHGPADLMITGARPFHKAGSGDVTFLDSEDHAKDLAQCQAAALIVRQGFRDGERPVMEVAEPILAFAALYPLFHPQPSMPPPGVDPHAAIHPTVQIGPEACIQGLAAIAAGTRIGARCRIYPGVFIGPMCRIGDDVTLYPNAVIYHGCTLGHRVTIHANAVIGADGFGYRTQGGQHVKIPQYGGVCIEDDVEIGAGTTIDRGTFEPTIIGRGTKIDNLVQIGHNCHIGRHNLLVSQVGIAGSSSTGDYVVMAGQVGVADHVHIGDQAVLGAQAGVHKDIPAGWRVLGAPARPERDAKIILLSMDRLPEIRQDVRKIKKHLGLAG